MAASWSKVTAEEMEKAMADNDYLYDQIPQELKVYYTDADEFVKRMEEKEAKMKKKICVIPPHKLQMILNYEFKPLSDHRAVDELVEQDKEKYKYLGMLMNVCDIFERNHNDFMRSWQEKVRKELETKGYATYEVMYDDKEEQEAVEHQTLQGRAGGRRRHCSGVTESGRGGAVRRLN